MKEYVDGAGGGVLDIEEPAECFMSTPPPTNGRIGTKPGPLSFIRSFPGLGFRFTILPVIPRLTKSGFGTNGTRFLRDLLLDRDPDKLFFRPDDIDRRLDRLRDFRLDLDRLRDFRLDLDRLRDFDLLRRDPLRRDDLRAIFFAIKIYF